MANMIAAAASSIAAVCNVVLLILLWKWYGPNGGRR